MKETIPVREGDLKVRTIDSVITLQLNATGSDLTSHEQVVPLECLRCRMSVVTRWSTLSNSNCIRDPRGCQVKRCAEKCIGRLKSQTHVIHTSGIGNLHSKRPVGEPTVTFRMVSDTMCLEILRETTEHSKEIDICDC